MKDANNEFATTMTGRLVRDLNAEEALRRNALSRTEPGFNLVAGDLVTVVDRFEGGRSFLIEFSRASSGDQNRCDWMGVVPAGDVELIGDRARVE